MLVSANGYTQIKVNRMITEVKRPIIDNKVEHLNINCIKRILLFIILVAQIHQKKYIYTRKKRQTIL